MESEILKYICANQGAVNADDIKYNLFPGDSTNDILRNQQKFALCYLSGEQKVVARTSLRFCRVKGCAGTCGGLHLCKNLFLTGSCHFTRPGRVCSFSHELNSDHNRRILREHELDSLSRAELCTLLLQNDILILPSICHDYNNGDGEFGRCTDGAGCKRLHICEKFVSRDCNCSKVHDFNAPQPSKTLREKGVSDTFLHILKCIYANKEALRLYDIRRGQRGRFQREQHNSAGGFRGGRGRRGNMGNPMLQKRATSLNDIIANIDNLDLYTCNGLGENKSPLNTSSSDISAAANDSDVSSDSSHSAQKKRYRPPARVRGGNRGNHPQPQRTPTEICMYFIKGHCKHMERCFKAHDKMPYRWEVLEGDKWTALSDNETIEKDYCDPQNSFSSTSPRVEFETMTCGQNKVRRLSTLNSLIEPNFILTTEWLWYWQDEFAKWNLYASDASAHKTANTDSATLEQKFLNNDRDVVDFMAGSQSYSLRFQDMMQTNQRYSTGRSVRRRPRFVSAADVQAKRARKPPDNATGVPVNWDKQQIPQTGFSRISLKHTSEEFRTAEVLFFTTMQGHDIMSVERIQNKALWEVFQWQKTQMKNNNGGRDELEKLLFHGTDSKHVEAICRNNFDWRICGTHGTVYGQGSYFARDAKFSHNYTGNSKVKTMFLSRVLVGSYTKGSSEYRRPPCKDEANKIFYDSCVDNIMNPAIFVIFEKHQIYPEYLIQYRARHPLVDIASQASVSLPQQVAVPKAILKKAPTQASPVHLTGAASASTPMHQFTFTLKPVPTPKPAAQVYLTGTASTTVQQPTVAQIPTLKPVPTPKPAAQVYLTGTASTTVQQPTVAQIPTLKPVPTPKPAAQVYLTGTASTTVQQPTVAQIPTLKPVPTPKPAAQVYLTGTASTTVQQPTVAQIPTLKPVPTPKPAAQVYLTGTASTTVQQPTVAQIPTLKPVPTPKPAAQVYLTGTASTTVQQPTVAQIPTLKPVPTPKPAAQVYLTGTASTTVQQPTVAQIPTLKPVPTPKPAAQVYLTGTASTTVQQPTVAQIPTLKPVPTPKPAAQVYLTGTASTTVQQPTVAQIPTLKPVPTPKPAAQVYLTGTASTTVQQPTVAQIPTIKPVPTPKPAAQVYPTGTLSSTSVQPARAQLPTVKPELAPNPAASVYHHSTIPLSRSSSYSTTSTLHSSEPSYQTIIPSPVRQPIQTSAGKRELKCVIA